MQLIEQMLKMCAEFRLNKYKESVKFSIVFWDPKWNCTIYGKQTLQLFCCLGQNKENQGLKS